MAMVSAGQPGTCIVIPRIVEKGNGSYEGRVTVQLVIGITKERFSLLSNHFFPKDTWKSIPYEGDGVKFQTISSMKERVEAAVQRAVGLLEKCFDGCTVLKTEAVKVQDDRKSEELPKTQPL